ncbi:hypothetical protein B0H16DRAFT_1714748 [Mycena metata]|uniref:Uncharacterized protein n=1 Tax=Mycena metata TaxID=1033252 RepID=A0AAD7NR21_9AGAR|nr:hypothetical protein B0H16DRAFT_1714748 [Mycena metata]
MQATAHTTPLVHRRAPGATFLGPVPASDEYRELEAQLAECFSKLSIHDQWSKCRLQNGRARPSAGEHVLRPLLATTNLIPYLFPATLANLRALDRSSVLALLHVYEQSVDPDIELDPARRAFARFVGAPPY